MNLLRGLFNINLQSMNNEGYGYEHISVSFLNVI